MNLRFNETTWSLFALLRFILAMIVVCSHLEIYFFRNVMSASLEYISMLGGKAAVMVFLLISGISISYSYAKSKEGYFKRRFLRIYPLYFIAVLFTILVQFILGSPYTTSIGFTFASAGLGTSLANIILLQGISSVTITYNQALWSISTEVFFYLLLPFLNRANTKIILFLIFISILTYAFTYYYIPFQSLFGFINFIYIWPWLIGFLIIKYNNIIKPLILIFIGVIAFASNKIIAVDSYGWITFFVFSLIIIIAISYNFTINANFRKVFNFLGEISYPLYLFHMPLFLLFSYWKINNDWLFVLLLLILIVPINYLFDKLLKNIFWKPLVLKTEIYFKNIQYNLLNINKSINEN